MLMFKKIMSTKSMKTRHLFGKPENLRPEEGRLISMIRMIRNGSPKERMQFVIQYLTPDIFK